MTMPLPGFEVKDMGSSDHKFVFRVEQARTILHFGCDDEMVAERWKYAISQGSKGYDLNREDVLRLGRPVSSSSSETDEEANDAELEEEEDSETDQISDVTESGLELRMDKYIDEDSNEDSLSEGSVSVNPSANEKFSQTDSANGENIFSNDAS